MPSPEQRKRLVAVDGALALIAVILIVQIWLLSATLDAFLAGRHRVAWPAAIASLVLFGGCFGLLRMVMSSDRQRR